MIKALPPNLLRKHEFERTKWDVTLPLGVSLDMLKDPKFWQHHAGTIRKHDLVFVTPQDGSWSAELFVEDVAPGFVKMRVERAPADVSAASAAAAFVTATADAAARYAEPRKDFPCVDYKKATGWRVLGFDGSEAKNGLASEADAQRELEIYLKRAGRATKEKAA